MSSLTGLAQFTNRFAQNIMGYEEGKKKEAERLADKEYNRSRQEAIDDRAQQSHDLNQKQGNVSLKNDQLVLGQNKVKSKQLTDQTTYQNTIDQIKQLKTIGADDAQSIDVIMNSVNSNSKLPYKLQVERDQNGKVIARQDKDGNTFYYQSIIDKETGEELGRKATTVDDMMNSYTQLQRGGAIEAEQQAAIAARQAKQQEIKDKLTLKAGEAKIDQSKYAANKGVDVKAHAINQGVDHDYAMQKLGVQNVYDLEKLAVQHGYRLEEMDRQTVNSISQSIANSDINSGGTPNIDNADRGTQVRTIIGSLTGTESGGKAGAFRTNTDGRSFGGLIQMGNARLADYARATGGKPITAAQFKSLSPAQQQRVNEWHVNDLIDAANATGAIGSTINGVPVTLGGLVAVAHLGGKGGMQKFIQSKGRYNPSDQLGTSLTDYLQKHSTGTGGVQVRRSVPALPKTSGKSSTNSTSGRGITTPQAFNERVDKGVGVALKTVKSELGIKTGPTESAYLSKAGRKLKDMTRAKDYQEFINLYGEAADLVLQVVPDRDRKKLSQSEINALQHRLIAQMTGASSLGNFKQMIFDLNPNTAGESGSASNNPFYQAPKTTAVTRQPAPQGRQVPKLAALYAKGKPVKTDPKSGQAMRDLNNLNDSIDW